MAVSRDFRERQQAKSEARLSEALEQIPQDIQAGSSYHQVGSLKGGPIRTRTAKAPVEEGELFRGGGNVFGPRAATVLLSQMSQRGMSSPELVHPMELSALGHSKLPERRMDAPLAAARAGSVAVPLGGAGSDRLMVRGASYDLLHVETQTTLRPVAKRLMDGRNQDERTAISGTVGELVRRSGVQVKTHGRDRVEIHQTDRGPQVRCPPVEKFDSASRWATAVMRAASTAIVRSDDMSRQIQDEAIGRRPVESARRTGRRSIPGGSKEYQEVRSKALGEVMTRGAKAIADREGVYLATDQPRDAAHYDAEKKTFYPQRSTRAESGQAETRDLRFKEQMVIDLAKAVGTKEERAAVKDGHALQVAEAAGVRVTGMNPKPEGLTPGQEKARSAMVGDVAARQTLERLGIAYEPGDPPAQLKKDQAEYARQPGALDQVWREAASVRGHLVSRDWQVERTAEQLEHSKASSFEAPERAQAKGKDAPERERDGVAQEAAQQQPDAAAGEGGGEGDGGQGDGQGERKSLVDRAKDLVR